MSAPIKVLLVDDQIDFLEPIAFWMRKKGYEVEMTTDPLRGVLLVHKNTYDVVFLDYKMPSMTGLEVAAKIREFNQNLALVMVTSHPDDAIIHQNKNKDLKIAGFFSKMGSFEELERVLDVILRGVGAGKAKKLKDGN